jgi:hypothetical protein
MPAGGHRPWLIYRYARLLGAAHQQLGGPIVLVWDCENGGISFGTVVWPGLGLTIVSEQRLPAAAFVQEGAEQSQPPLVGASAERAPCQPHTLGPVGSTLSWRAAVAWARTMRSWSMRLLGGVNTAWAMS